MQDADFRMQKEREKADAEKAELLEKIRKLESLIVLKESEDET